MVEQAKIDRFMRRTFPYWYSGSSGGRDASVSQDIKKLDEATIERVVARHPDLNSVHAVLLAEILDGQDFEDRIRSANIYGEAQYRRGFKKLAELALELEDEIAEGIEDWATPHSKLRSELLLAFGYMDTAASHAFLKGALERWSDGWQQCLAIDGMAFEVQQFEPGLVLPFVTTECHPELTKSALYALMNRCYFSGRQEELERLVRPLLDHEEPLVKCYVMMVISPLDYAQEYRYVFESFLNDPNKIVREYAEGELRRIDDRLIYRDEKWERGE